MRSTQNWPTARHLAPAPASWHGPQMIWIAASLFAGLFQAARTAIQHRIRGQLSVNAAGLVRYLYGLPVACVLLALYVGWRGDMPNHFGLLFLPYAIAAGVAQLLGTLLLIMAFGFRNYVVGTAYAKTEAVQGALLAFVLIGESLSPMTIIGIAIGVAGVLLVSVGAGKLSWRDVTQPAALCGMGAGFLFVLTSIFVKQATRQLDTPDPILAALVTLVAVLAIQLIVQGAYVVAREREQLGPVFSSWRISGQVGLLAALGSACWFTGFATAPVALVRAVGQVEVVFTLAFSHYYLKETMTSREAQGLLLVGLGVVLSLLGGL
jgi:drug/metabolite transporter (DMT)-like permease